MVKVTPVVDGGGEMKLQTGLTLEPTLLSPGSHSSMTAAGT